MSKEKPELATLPNPKQPTNANQLNIKNNQLQTSQKEDKKQNHQSPSSNLAQKGKLEHIKSQKSTIMHELEQINEAIETAKEDIRPKSILQKREEISNNREARKHAISFINHHKIKKQELLERRRLYEEKTVALLKKQAQESSKKREMQESMLRDEKRRAISIRISECKAKREELKSIERQSNLLINKLMKQDGYARQKAESPLKPQGSIQYIQKRPHIGLTDIKKHEEEYLQRKQEQSKKKERSISISYPIKKFKKNKWAEKLDEEQERQKEEERLKSIDKRMRIEKRMKYGELISSLFVNKNKAKTEPGSQSNHHQNSKSIYVMPTSKIPRTTIAKSQKSEEVEKRLYMKRLINSHYSSIQKEQKSQSRQDRQKKQQSIHRQRKLRKETSERLKKMESSFLQKTSSEPQSKYQSNFQNYLGQVKLKRKNDSQQWSNILNNSDLSQEEKYTQLMRNAVTLENKAKLKQSMKEANDEVVDLYLDSIQVKLAILESI